MYWINTGNICMDMVIDNYLEDAHVPAYNAATTNTW